MAQEQIGAPLQAQVMRRSPSPDGLDLLLSLRLPSELGRVEEAVELVAAHCQPHFVDPHAVRFNLRVALTEALANAIIFGNGEDPAKEVSVRVALGPHAIELEVSDEGNGFDWHELPDPTLPENLLKPDGRGLFLIRELVNEVRFNSDGNSILMIIRRA